MKISKKFVKELIITLLLLAILIFLTNFFQLFQLENNSTTLVIITDNQQEHQFNVEVALTNEQKSRGLMYRKYLPQNNGMLFLFKEPQLVTMWMEKTEIPLDIIFINTEGQITKIARKTIPFSTDSISSNTKVTAVLEVNAGITGKLGIKEGDMVKHFFKLTKHNL